LEDQYKQKVRLIIGDTLARLTAGGNENSGQDMGIVIRNVDKIRMATGSHFLLIHHNGKNAALGARGWGGVKAAIDTEIEITDSIEGRCAEIKKQRDLDTKGSRIGFHLERVNLGLTKWKSTATSCVVISDDHPPKIQSTKPNAALAALEEYLHTIDHSVQKSLCVSHFTNRHHHTAIYRALVRLKNEGRITDFMGNITKVEGKW
jgi:putative DNA primase/helicase